MRQLSEAIKAYRLQNRLEQKEVAGLLGISREYYALIEEGKKLPSPKLLQKIQSHLGITIDFTPPPHLLRQIHCNVELYQ